MRFSRLNRYAALVATAAALLLPLITAKRLSAVPGDVNQDGKTDADDISQIADHILGKSVLSSQAQAIADVNGDGKIDVADILALRMPMTRLIASSPLANEQGVSVRRETILRFNYPLNPLTVNPGTFFAEFGHDLLPATIHLSPDQKTVTMFYDPPMPSNSRVRVTIDGDMLRDVAGNTVDADDDSFPGGLETIDFDTLGVTVLAGTVVTGRIFDAFMKPADGETTPSINVPLEGVKISVDGAEDTLFTFTDALGNYRLDPAPVGKFFVHIDGRNVVPPVGTSWAYYPYVGKAFSAVAGRTNPMMDIFLPLIAPDTLQTVSEDTDTTITFPPSVLAQFPQMAGTMIMVPAGSLFADDGTRGGMVGIGPVPSDRLPGPLPGGLEFPIVLTVQTNGPTNFDVPVPVCFPNLPDPGTGAPLPPGTKNFLYSFSHDKGVWEAIGPMTVSADGTTICTDPGFGILAPGWHGSGPPPFEPPGPDFCGAGPAGGGGPGGPGGPLPAGAIKIAAGGKKGKDCPKCVFGQSDESVQSFAECVDYFTNFKQEVDELCDQNLLDCLDHARTDAASLRCTREHKKCKKGSTDFFKSSILQCANDDANNCFKKKSSAKRINALEGSTAEDQIAAILDQIDALVSPFDFGDIPDDVAAQVNALRAMADSLAGGDASQFVKDAIIAEERNLAKRWTPDEILRGMDDLLLAEPDNPIFYAAEIARADTIFTVRGETGPNGQYTLFIPRNAVLLDLSFYDPVQKAVGMAWERFRPEGPTKLRRLGLRFVDDTFPDFDGDGAADEVEEVIGTDPTNPDTDGDGVPDGAEIDQGTDPLDGQPVITGVIGSAKIPGTPLDVDAHNNLVAVAAGSQGGVSLLNVFEGMQPRIIGRVDTPGAAQRVALEGNFIAVADGDAGATVIDISDPPASQVLYTIPPNSAASVQAVAAAAGIGYFGLSDGFILAVDLSTGLVIDTGFVSGSIVDLAFGGDFLYALTTTSIQALEFRAGKLTPQGSAASPVSLLPNRRLFIGGGVAYAVHGDGYNTFDVASDPANPSLIAAGVAGGAQPRDWRRLVLNGSGLGVGAVGGATSNGDEEISIYDTSNSSVVGNDAFLTQFLVPGNNARSVSIFNGLAYVADETAGVHVLNYLAYDNQGTSPTLTLAASFALAPVAMAEEGKQVRVEALVTDDVQVRNVEFFIDGSLASTDGNFPFEHRFITPARDEQASFTLQLRATDTGGNSIVSPLVNVILTDDVTSPSVTQFKPRGGAREVKRLVAIFSEPILASSLRADTFKLSRVGDFMPFDLGIPTTNGKISYLSEINAAVIDFDDPLPAGRYLAELTQGVTDIAGNPLDAPFSASFIVSDAVFWTAGIGSWDKGVNWSTSVIPSAADSVVAMVPEPVTITHSTGNDTITNIFSEESLNLSGGSLTVNGPFLTNAPVTFGSTNLTVNGTLTLNAGMNWVGNGTLANAVVVPAPGFPILYTGNGTLDGATLNGVLTMFSGGTNLNIQNGLVLNGVIQMFGGGGSTGASINFSGGTVQTISGTGRVQFLSGGNNSIGVGNGGLIIGPSMTVQGVSGSVGSGSFPLTNQGTLESTGGFFGVQGDPLTNNNLVKSSSGNLFFGSGTSVVVNNAQIVVESGSSFTIQGNWTNAGTITSNDGTVGFGGDFQFSDIGTFSRTGGLVNLVGTLNNAPGLTLNSTTGNWRIAGGTILGGTVDTIDGTQLQGVGSGRLDGVTLNGTLAMLSGGTNLEIRNGLVLDGLVQMVGGGGSTGAGLTFNDGTVQTISGSGLVQFASGGNNSLSVGTGGLIIGPSMTVQAVSGSVGSSSFPLTNQGTIESTGGGFVGVDGNPLTNNNLMKSSGGGLFFLGSGTTSVVVNNSQIVVESGSTFRLQGNWTNAGTITSNSGTIDFGGAFQFSDIGTFNRTGGLVNLVGTLDNAPGLTLNSATGNWRIAGGTILGGTIATINGTQLEGVSNGTFDGVTLNGVLAMFSGGTSLEIRNGLVLNGEIQMFGGGGSTGASVNFNDGSVQTLSGSGMVNFLSGGFSNNSLGVGTGGLIIGPLITIQGASGGIGSSSFPLTNQGLIKSTGSGFVQVAGNPLINQGTIDHAGGGSMFIAGVITEPGMMHVAAASVLQFSGAYSPTGASQMSIDIEGTGAGQFGTITVGPAATLGGTLAINRPTNFVPSLGTTFTILTATSVTGNFATVTGTDLGNGNKFQVNTGATSVTLEVVVGP